MKTPRPRTLRFCWILAALSAIAVVVMAIQGLGLRDFALVLTVYVLIFAVAGMPAASIDNAEARRINPRLRMHSPALFFFMIVTTLGFVILSVLMLIMGLRFADHTFSVTLLLLGLSAVELLWSFSKKPAGQSTEESTEAAIRATQRL